MVQPLQVAALALPIPDGIVHKIELREAAEILDRKHRAEHRLQAGVFPLRWQQVHLQESLIGHPLDFDEIRDLDRAFDLRKVQPLALADGMISITHFYFSSRSADGCPARHTTAKHTTARVPGGTRSRMPVPGVPVAYECLMARPCGGGRTDRARATSLRLLRRRLQTSS